MVEENNGEDSNGSIKPKLNHDLSLSQKGGKDSDNPSVQALADHLMNIAKHERTVWCFVDNQIRLKLKESDLMRFLISHQKLFKGI